MPGSVNIPFHSGVDHKTKLFKSPEKLKKIFESKGIDLNKPIVASCGIGKYSAYLLLFIMFPPGVHHRH